MTLVQPHPMSHLDSEPGCQGSSSRVWAVLLSPNEFHNYVTALFRFRLPSLLSLRNKVLAVLSKWYQQSRNFLVVSALLLLMKIFSFGHFHWKSVASDWDFLAFRRRKFCYKNSDFLTETFNQSDIFEMKLTSAEHWAELEITELKSVYLGRCYMVCFTGDNSVGTKAYIWVKRNMELKGDMCAFIKPSYEQKAM